MSQYLPHDQKAYSESHLMQAVSDHLAGRTGIDKDDGEPTSEHVTRTHKALVASKFKLPPSMHLPTCDARGPTGDDSETQRKPSRCR